MDAIAYTLHNIRDFITLIHECNYFLREKETRNANTMENRRKWKTFANYRRRHSCK